jgi:putative aldouronate transport system substrate-binding protein
MAAYNAYPYMWREDISGKLVHGAVQQETKDALRALQTLYRDGQIDSEFAFKDGDKVKEDIAAGKIGMLYGQQWSSFVVQANYERDPSADWRAFPIVSATQDLVQVPLPFATRRFYAVRKDYAHPEAVVKLFNLYLEKIWGEMAEYETYYSTPFPAWQFSPVTPFPARKNLEAYRQIEEARLTGNKFLLDDEARSISKNIEAYETRNDNKGWGWQRTYGPGGAFAILDGYEKNGQLLYEPFVGAPTKTMIEEATILDNLVQDTFVNIILGSPLEDFDRFVEKWNRLGGDDMTAEVNQWYADRT